MNETEYHMKNYGDRGVLTSREISLSGLPVRNQSSRLMLWCYTPFKVLYFSAGSLRTNATGGHLDWV